MKFPKLEGSQHISSYCVACLWPSLLQSFIQTSDPSGTTYIEEWTTLSRRDTITCSYNFFNICGDVTCYFANTKNTPPI